MAIYNKNLHLYGLIGYPVKHSFSPAMHNAAFKAAGISAEYRLFEVKPDELSDFLCNPEKEVTDTKGNKVIAGDIIGFNITIPHKVRANDILASGDIEKFRNQTEISSETSIHQDIWHRMVSGAVNTVKRESEDTFCYNTDVWGFLKSLENDLKFNHTNKNVLLIGCGGAGRAIVAGLSHRPERVRKLYIYEQNLSAVESAREQFAKFGFVGNMAEFIFHDDIKDKIRDCHLLINASPLGMKENDPLVIDKKLLHQDLSVYDVVYNRETQLIKDAKEKGQPAVGGLNMLIYQGAMAWGIWTGREPPVDVMKQAISTSLREVKLDNEA